jgi:hypothetical protein
LFGILTFEEVLMPSIKVLVPHAKKAGVGAWRAGDVYSESDFYAQEKVRGGLAEYVAEGTVRTKESSDVYRSDRPTIGVTLRERSGNWYWFSDGEKVLGKSKAAEYLGVTVEELEALSVDSDDE